MRLAADFLDQSKPEFARAVAELALRRLVARG